MAGPAVMPGGNGNRGSGGAAGIGGLGGNDPTAVTADPTVSAIPGINAVGC